MTWIVNDKKAFANYDDLLLDDVRLAIVYGMEELQARNMAMSVAKELAPFRFK